MTVWCNQFQSTAIFLRINILNGNYKNCIKRDRIFNLAHSAKVAERATVYVLPTVISIFFFLFSFF